MDVFDLVAKIRLDDSEYEQGVGKAKGTFSSLASGVGKGLATVAKVGAAAVTAAVTGVAALTKMGVEGYAQYEQLVGGVETLFKDSQATVMKYAENAYKTSGLSANAYMETVTSFSASLIQSLDGDTAKAAEVGNMAITDMSDNANKMGTSIEMIQNAYNGFAKGNFTMLDNLKLGYGGTQEEMKRLLKDAEKISGIKYDISSFADVSEAIHVMQQSMEISGYSVDELSEKLRNASLTQEEVSKVAESMGISYEEASQRMMDGSLTAQDANILLGTTAREAATTIEGSLSMMKGAWQNLVVGMADETANMEVLINNFVESAATAAQNLIPRIAQTLQGIGQLIKELSPVIAEAIPVLVAEVLPTLLAAGVSLVTSIVEGIITALPALYTALMDGLVIILTDVFGVSEEKAQGFADGLDSVFQRVAEGFRAMVDSAQTEGTLLNQVWEGLKKRFEVVKAVLVIAFDALKKGFNKCAKDINTDGTWLNKTWKGIQDAIKALLDFWDATFDAAVAVFKWVVKQIKTEGTVLNNIWDGIKKFTSTIWEAIKKIISNAIEIIKNVFKLFTAVLKGDWSAAWEAMKNLLSLAWDNIKTIVSTAIDLVKTSINTGLNAIKSATSSIWEGIKSVISNVWNSIKSAVSGAVDSVKNTVSNVWNTIKSTTSTVWNAIKSAITSPINDAWSVVSGVIDKLKSAFDFEWSLPDLKLPHISVSGGVAPYGIGGKGSLPSFSVQWYKKAYDNAMILSRPTIFGYSDGKFLGGGDGNGNEIVAGESYLLGMIGKTVESKNERVVALLSALLEATVDGNKETIRALMSDRTFAVGERDFARLVRTYA